MRTHRVNKFVFRFGIMVVLLLTLIAGGGIAQAQSSTVVTDSNLRSVSTVLSSSNNNLPEVQTINGLTFTAYSATRVATVGQAVFVIAKFVNRGKTTFTNLVIDCPELGRSLVSISETSYPTTVLPGRSGFQEQRWQAVRPGAGPIFCTLTATDNSTGQQIILTAPTVNITVK